ncbi:nuclear transport factor 2 family protein [Pseudonocardia sp. RS010]|uniref:nuclear transport factor 2 family protein n=1 Tax=Pseudonocardia sp. RS010 TaxID=3385979 RepID=UPI00399F8C9C
MVETTATAKSPADVFRKLAELLAAKKFADAAQLYAEDVEVRNPFAPDGPTASRGREAVAAFFSNSTVKSLEFTDVSLIEGIDGETVVAEFDMSMMGAEGTPFKLPSVFVLRVRDGLIVESRDYVGPRRAG